MEWARTATRILCILWICSICGSYANAQTSRKDTIKASYVYNFAKFVEWPEAVFAEKDTPFRLCIFEDARLSEVLAGIREVNVHGRAVVVKSLVDFSGVDTCHLLYFGASNESQWPGILLELKGLPILTIAESDQFSERGGMIQLFKEDNMIRFDINVAAVRFASLKISSRLLVRANIVLNKLTGG